MPTIAKLAVEREARPALELLIGLSAATSRAETHDESWVPAPDRWSPELRESVAEVGRALGRGVAAPARSGARASGRRCAVVRQEPLARGRPGASAPSRRRPCARVGRASSERARSSTRPQETRRRSRALLEHPRYYAGRAAEALPTLLSVPPKETKRRLVDCAAALRRGGLLAERAGDHGPDRHRGGEPRVSSPQTLAPQALIAKRHARVCLRARAGVRPRRPRPARRRATASPPLPAPRRAGHLLPGLAGAARPGSVARARRPCCSAGRSGTAAEWPSSGASRAATRRSTSWPVQPGSRSRQPITTSRSCVPPGSSRSAETRADTGTPFAPRASARRSARSETSFTHRPRRRRPSRASAVPPAARGP